MECRCPTGRLKLAMLDLPFFLTSGQHVKTGTANQAHCRYRIRKLDGRMEVDPGTKPSDQ